MTYLNIEIVNPKARKLLKELEELNLITITEKSADSFLKVVAKFRKKNAKISLDEITKEVKLVRKKRYAK